MSGDEKGYVMLIPKAETTWLFLSWLFSITGLLSGNRITPGKTFKLIPGHRLHLLWHPCCPRNTWTTGRGYNWWSSGFIQRIQRSRLSIFPSFGLYCTLHTLHVAPEVRVRKEGVGGATINFTKIILKNNRMSLKGLQWVSREKHEGILSNQ